MSKKERLQKVIAQSGITSRRKAEALILAKRVRVNGQIVSELGSKVSSDDLISVDNVEINYEEKVYYLINKPKNVVTSVDDQFNRTTVVDLINDRRRIYPVGRLDYDTTGLLILTNDGDFANVMMHPKYEIFKTYQVFINKILSEKMIKGIQYGIVIDGYKTSPAKIEIVSEDKNKNSSEVLLSIREGRNHQVKKIFETLGVNVKKLHRIKFGNLDLGDLNIGQYRQLRLSEVNALLKLAKDV